MKICVWQGLIGQKISYMQRCVKTLLTLIATVQSFCMPYKPNFVLVGLGLDYASRKSWVFLLVKVTWKPGAACLIIQYMIKTIIISDKGNCRISIGYCPHLSKSPLLPFQPAQQSPWLRDNYNCTCITSSSFAGNDELVAVEDSIDVGNVLWIFYDCL